MNKRLEEYIHNPEKLIRELIEEWECEVEENGKEVVSVYDHTRLSQDEFREFIENGIVPKEYVSRIYSL